MMVALAEMVFLPMPIEDKAKFQACCPDIAFGQPAFAEGDGKRWMVISHPLISAAECEAMQQVALDLGISDEDARYFDLPEGQALPDGWVPRSPPGFEDPIIEIPEE